MIKVILLAVLIFTLAGIVFLLGYKVAKIDSYGLYVEPSRVMKKTSADHFGEDLSIPSSDYTENFKFGDHGALFVYAGDGQHVSLFVKSNEGTFFPLGSYQYDRESGVAGLKLYTSRH